METAVKRARGRPSEGAREALIEAARNLFIERDFDRVSTAAILERSGVSRGALYHHFPTKLDLFKAVFDAGERRIVGLIAEQAEGADSAFDSLVRGSTAYLRLCETDVELRRIGLRQSRVVLGWEGWRAASREHGIALMIAGVTEAIEASEIPPGDPETIAHVLLGALIEAAMLVAIAEDDRAAVRRRAEVAIVDLLNGLRR